MAETFVAWPVRGGRRRRGGGGDGVEKTFEPLDVNECYSIGTSSKAKWLESHWLPPYQGTSAEVPTPQPPPSPGASGIIVSLSGYVHSAVRQPLLIWALVWLDVTSRRRQKRRLIWSNKLPFPFLGHAKENGGRSKGEEWIHLFLSLSLSLSPSRSLASFSCISRQKVNWPEKSSAWIFNIFNLIWQMSFLVRPWKFNKKEWREAEKFCLRYCFASTFLF